MGTILANTVLTMAARNLNDPNFAVLNKQEFTDLLDAGQRDFALRKPDINIVAGAYQLVAGALQSLPDGSASFEDPASAVLSAAICLIRASRNMGSDGATPGNVIFTKSRDEMDAQFPDWPTKTASATVQVVMYDPEVPLRFWTFPAQPATGMGWLELMYAALPADITRLVDNSAPAAVAVINIPDIYANALADYINYRYMLKHEELAANPGLADMHKQAVIESLGLKNFWENIEAREGKKT